MTEIIDPGAAPAGEWIPIKSEGMQKISNINVDAMALLDEIKAKCINANFDGNPVVQVRFNTGAGSDFKSIQISLIKVDGVWVLLDFIGHTEPTSDSPASTVAMLPASRRRKLKMSPLGDD